MDIRMGCLGAAGLALVVAGCAGASGGDGGRGGGSGFGGTGGFGGAAASGGAAGVAGISMPTGGAGGVAGVAASGGTGGRDPNLCGGATVEPEVIEVMVDVEVTRASPIAIYVMLDFSASMILLWPGAVQAITDFVNDPMSAGLDVALSLFPVFGDQCAAASYNPPLVPMGRLPMHAANITGGLPGGPTGIGTPIEGAIKGATEFCKNFTPADPADAGEECVVLFITDGAPSGCAEDTPTIVASASAAGVPVYTIALNGVTDLALLNSIASTTGTDCDPAGPNNACDLTGGASFIDALTQIRDTIVTVETHIETQVQALTCEWGIPPPDPGKSFNEDEVNVLFTSGAGATPDTFLFVPDAASCGSAANAWHYDDPAAPTRILACPETCKVLEASEGAKVDIQLGCPTLVVE